MVYGSAALGASMLLKACAPSTTTTARSPAADASSPTAPASGDGIKVGVLHSLSGTMAISEKSVVDSTLLAIDEINASGGVLGKQIIPIVEDGASDWPTFAEKARKLIDQDQVVVIFGCWTSASRKAVLPVFEEKNHMLFYPVQYEGQECSKNIFYTGAAPNQQIEPSVDWLLENKGKEFYLVGSDYVFPRTANTIIKAQVAAKGGTVVGEDYLPLGNTEVAPIIAKIRSALPNGGVIYNTLNGDSNVAFFKQLQGAA
jgi:urea-binding protein